MESISNGILPQEKKLHHYIVNVMAHNHFTSHANFIYAIDKTNHLNKFIIQIEWSFRPIFLLSHQKITMETLLFGICYTWNRTVAHRALKLYHCKRFFLPFFSRFMLNACTFNQKNAVHKNQISSSSFVHEVQWWCTHIHAAKLKVGKSTFQYYVHDSFVFGRIFMRDWLRFVTQYRTHCVACLQKGYWESCAPHTACDWVCVFVLA